MIVFSRGRAAPHIAKAAAIRRTAAISFCRKFVAENKRPPTQGEIASAIGMTITQARSARAWMTRNGVIKVVAK